MVWTSGLTWIKFGKSLGFCPQHNVLFDFLSVEEHLQFYACLKGVKLERCDVTRIAMKIGLHGKLKTYASKLSGGMKRKLSVGIALLGE